MEKLSSKKEQMSAMFDLLNKTRFQIYTYLNMYGKLSLTEISEKLNKSKSTIHEHIKKLKEVNGIIEEKRAIYSDPNSDKPKVFENVYSLNPEFSTELEAFIPGFDPEKLTPDQAKAIINLLLFVTKIRKANLNIAQRFLEKVSKNFKEDPEKMINIVKQLIYGLFIPYSDDVDESITISKDDLKIIQFPVLSSYLHLSPKQFNLLLERFGQFCQLFYSEEFIKASSDEKPYIFMITGIPMKSFLEFLNQ
ncbi:MAG: winged helix-turn-helix domain-containing protein [Candidatus Hodarchaeota archaeon]